MIPAISTGLVASGTAGAGERFIQPVLDDGRKLDDLAGDGWRLFVRDARIGGDARGISRIVAADLPDRGAVLAWLDARKIDAVLVRPDHYVFGSAEGSAAPLLDLRERQLQQPTEIAA